MRESWKLTAITLGLLVAAPGCCTIQGWLGMNEYVVGIVADEDANHNGSTNILMIWPSPEKTFEVGEIRNFWNARKWAETWQPQGQCRFAELGDFARDDHTDPPLEDPSQVRQCGAHQLFVFTTMEDPEGSDPDRVTHLVRQVPLNDPSAPATNYILLHLHRDDFEVKFYNSYDELLFFCRKPY